MYRTADNQIAIAAWRYILGAIGAYLMAICTARVSCSVKWKDVADTWTFMFGFSYVQSYASRGLIKRYTEGAPKVVIGAYEQFLRWYCMERPDCAEKAVESMNRHVRDNWEVTFGKDGELVGTQVQWEIIKSDGIDNNSQVPTLRRLQFFDRRSRHYGSEKCILRPLYLIYLHKVQPILSFLGLSKSHNLSLASILASGPYRVSRPSVASLVNRFAPGVLRLPLLHCCCCYDAYAVRLFEEALNGSARMLPIEIQREFPKEVGKMSLPPPRTCLGFDESTSETEFGQDERSSATVSTRDFRHHPKD